MDWMGRIDKELSQAKKKRRCCAIECDNDECYPDGLRIQRHVNKGSFTLHQIPILKEMHWWKTEKCG